ncbi:hypothetical protein VB711_23885 [Cronbergia sp. UHCC 0137]|uniref:hypothetical protein n=1 Tax=Cronbergia sp. UHCC 0137 TaxID=3110239 RepID=UPI002B1FEAFC|nr:hypothetical protein [Cronbergia sp. UHCC 0137]MEA5620857.1 hypothetical protein [Cronbergia sp. UHCC 0137]
MLINQQRLNSIKSTTYLIVKINDVMSEQFNGGGITTPQVQGNINQAQPSGNSQIPNVPGVLEVGLTPFYPPLPSTKLAHLSSLKKPNQATETSTIQPL